MHQAALTYLSEPNGDKLNTSMALALGATYRSGKASGLVPTQPLAR